MRYQPMSITTGLRITVCFTPDHCGYICCTHHRRRESGQRSEVEVVIHGKPKVAKIVKRPFYTPAYRR